MQQTPQTITLKEARARLKCGPDFLRREIARRAFRVFRINRKVVLVDAATFAEYEREKFAS
jgi:hypothetical protein